VHNPKIIFSLIALAFLVACGSGQAGSTFSSLPAASQPLTASCAKYRADRGVPIC
jgi:hypothetical protein